MRYKLLLLNFILVFCSISSYSQKADFTTSQPSGECSNTTVDFKGTASNTTTATSFTFNGGSLPTGWSSSPYTVSSSTCPGKDAPDKSSYFWATTLSPEGKRFVQTNTVDVSLGGDIEFYIRYGNNEGGFGGGCEQPDAPNEEVYLQYSIDEGATWIDIFGGWDTTGAGNYPWYNWYFNSITIPKAAQTANTLFRWYQPSNSDATFDNWGLEDVAINAIRPVTVTKWSWDFGDGSTASTKDATHTFASTSGKTDYTIKLTTTFTDNSTSTETKVYTVYVDNTPPTATCNATSYDLYASNGSCTIALPDLSNQIVANDDCSSVTITQSPAVGTVLKVGNHSVNFELEDKNGNKTTVCPISVNVIDNIAPTLTLQSLTRKLNQNGLTVAATDFITAVNDNCSYTISPANFSFNCVDLGTQELTITAEDPSGNKTTKKTSIIIEKPGSFVKPSAGNKVIETPASYTTIDENLVINLSGNVEGATVSINTNFQSGDVLRLPTGFTLPSGVTSSYNASAGVLTLSGAITSQELQRIFQNIQFSTTSSNALEREVVFNIGGGLSNSDNNHYYEYVDGSFTWSQAKADAATKTLNGLQGYLATATTASENEFIYNKLSRDAWIGGSDSFSEINAAAGSILYSAQSEAEGKWYWITGPEAGIQFSEGSQSVNGKFENWNILEPNNSNNSEHALEIFYQNQGLWNDLDGNTNYLGYIVEYGGLSGDQSCFEYSGVKILKLNAAPQISEIKDIENCPSEHYSFSVDIIDAEDSYQDLKVKATSANQKLIPDDNISIKHNGTNYDVTILPVKDLQATSKITLTVTDSKGVSSSKSFDYTAVDNVAPVVVTKDIKVALDGETATITPTMVDDGSSDACGIESMTLDVTTFKRTDIGKNEVTLTVTDVNGNKATAKVTVTVEDLTPPKASKFDPEQKQIDVSLQPKLSVTFDKPVQLNTSGILNIADADGVVQSYDLSIQEDRDKFVLSEDKLTVSLAIGTSLPVNTTLSVGISAGFVKDSYDNSLAEIDASSKVWTFTTTKLDQNITFSGVEDKVYGDAPFTLGDEKTDKGLTITYTAADATVVSITGNKATILKAGSTTITASQGGDDTHFAATSVEQNLKITQKAITVTADVKTKVYGETDPKLTYQITKGSLESGDALTGGLSRTAGETVGDYAITSTLSNSNYAITFVPKDLSITEKAITVTADAKTKVYGEVDPTLTYKVSPALESGDALTGSLSRTGGETVGDYAITSSLANANYDIKFVSADLSITEKAITVTADTKSKVYGEVDPTLTYKVSPALESGDVLSGSLSRVAGETVGDYAITSSLANANYEITFVSADLSITEKAITVTADTKTKVYGEVDPALTYQITTGSLERGDALNGSLSRTAGETVGDYAITSSLANANYDIKFVSADLSITEKAITVTADTKSKVYGEVDPTLTYKVSPALESGDALTGSLSRTGGETVGDYAITSSLANANYDITFVSADLSITEKAISVTADAKSKIYGEVDPTLTYTLSPALESGDALNGSLSRTGGETVGDYAITSSLANANYEITFVSADLSITEKAITVIADAKTKVYGEVDPTLTYKVSPALESGDALNGSLSRTIGETVGNYAITSTLTNVNYDITFVSADLSITEKAITVTADAKSKVYGEVDPTLTYKVSPALESGDALNGSLSRAIGETVGDYAITSSLANVNYDITFVSADLKIKKAGITGVTFTDATFTYDVNAHSLFVENLPQGATVSYEGNEQINAGTYKVTATVSQENYIDKVLTAALVIHKASQQITFDQIPLKHLEEDPDFQLEAQAGSRLPVTYTYSYISTMAPASVSTSGYVKLYSSGEVQITATQEGNDNYNAASPVMRKLAINSEDAFAYELTINGVAYDNPEKEIYYLIDCNDGSESTSIEVYTEANAIVSPSKNFTVNTPVPGIYRQDVQITSQDGSTRETYRVVVEKRFNFEDVVVQKFNNTLLINNNPETNGGYEFAAYEWYIDGSVVGTGQYYSAGDAPTDMLDTTKMYEVVLTTTDGDVIHTCATQIQLKRAGKLYVAPNPVLAGNPVTIIADFEPELLQDVVYAVYNQQGVLMQSVKCSGAKTPLTIDQGTPSGVYILAGSGALKEQSVKFIVR